MKRKVAMAMVAAMAVGSLTVPVMAEDGAAGGKIGISMPTQSLERDGSYLQKQFEDAGYEVELTYSDNETDRQVNDIQNLISDGVNLLVVAAIDGEALNTVMDEAADAGIPVIVIDRTIDDSDKYVSWVGSNFKTEGLAAGEWLKAYTDAKGISDVNVLVIEGSTGASATIGRTDGFKEIADANVWNILDSQTGDFTQAGGQEVMESYIKSYEGKFNVVVCQNDNEAFGAMDAMKAAGISYGVDGDVILVSFDACTAGLEYVMSGDINADFECNPLAAPFVEEVIKQLQAGETPEKEVYMTEHWFVNEDVLSTINVNGEDQDLTVVTKEIVDAQY